MAQKILHHYNDGEYDCILYTDGVFTVNGKAQPWFSDDERGGKPWLVRKFKSFKGLVKMAIKDGDFKDL